MITPPSEPDDPAAEGGAASSAGRTRSKLSRRSFLTAAALVGGAAAVGGYGARNWFGATPAAAATELPDPAESGIDHIVMVMMENRSFDHFLGWVPNADGKQAGLIYTDRYGVAHPTYHQIGWNNCGHPDPDHTNEGAYVELNGTQADGWLRAGENDLPAIGYYTKSDLAFLGPVAGDWTICDRYFSSCMSMTYPNRLYQHCGQTDRVHNSATITSLPTIWDRLADAGVRGTYYFSDTPFLSMWGTRYKSTSRTFPQFLTDAAAGNLPSVSFVDPRFQHSTAGASSDDHPNADIRVGEAFLNKVYRALTASPTWSTTLLVISYDEWGGFFDHVVPGRVPDVLPQMGRQGFRVPGVIISPRARRGYVDHTNYDHTSVLRTIAWRWNLPPLTVRDQAANNFAQALDFSSTGLLLDAPTYDVPDVSPALCTEAAESPEERSEWTNLRAVARAHRWALPT